MKFLGIVLYDPPKCDYDQRSRPGAMLDQYMSCRLKKQNYQTFNKSILTIICFMRISGINFHTPIDI